MDATEISRIINEKVKKIEFAKSGIDPNRILGTKDEKRSLPDFNPIYKKTVDLRDRISVHAEFDKIPYDIIRKRGPYEDDLQYLYRKDNWKSITMPYFMKAFSKLGRIMNKSNYAIQWDATQNEQKTYFENDIPTVSSIENYAEQVLLVEKILDPNALVVVKPYKIPVKAIDAEAGIKYVLDDSQMIDPIPVLVPCTRVVEYLENDYAIIISEDKSPVREGDKEIKEGIIFEIYDTENIWRVEQIGQKSKWEFSEPYVYYPHGMEYLPCEKLRGTLKQVDKRVYYESYFLNAIPHLDTALYAHSNLDISTNTQMFPQRSEIVDRCDNPECDNGWIYTHLELPGTDAMRREKRACGTCKGTGSLSRLGPMGVKQIIVPNGFNPNDPTQAPALPGIAYTAPPSEPLEFVFKKFKYDVVTAFLFLNIDLSDSDVKGSETALGKMIDRDELFSFLLRISNEIFETIDFLIETIGKMRYGNDFVKPVISPPTSFQIRSEKDLTDELAENKKAGVPDIALRQIIRQIISKRFSNQKNIEPIVNLAFAADRFITSNVIEMSARLANQTAFKWEAILHDSLYTFLDNILAEDPNFFDKQLKDQIAILQEIAKSIADDLGKEAMEKVKAVLYQDEPA